MILRRLTLLCCLPLAGCIGVHYNGTVASTLPYHAYDGDIADYPDLPDEPLPKTLLRVRAAPFVQYYPLPAAIRHAYSGTEASEWSAVELASLPEDALPKLLAADSPSADSAAVTLHGVVTDFQWYEISYKGVLSGAPVRGGRLVTRLRLVAGDGRVVFEGEKVTEGRASEAVALYRAHALEWLRDGQLAKAVSRAGGSR